MSARGVSLGGAVLMAAVLALTSASCMGTDTTTRPAHPRPPVPSTGASGHPRPPATTTTATAPTLRQGDTELRVSIRQVAGHLSKQARNRLTRHLGHTVNAWFRGGFLAGEYPRAHFPLGYRTFTADAAREAGSDRRLLTNAALGPRLSEVIAQRRQVRLSVLAPGGNARGATARVHLVLLGLRKNAARVRITVRGELYLTWVAGRHWRIFGYDITRSAETRP